MGPLEECLQLTDCDQRVLLSSSGQLRPTIPTNTTGEEIIRQSEGQGAGRSSSAFSSTLYLMV